MVLEPRHLFTLLMHNKGFSFSLSSTHGVTSISSFGGAQTVACLVDVDKDGTFDYSMFSTVEVEIAANYFTSQNAPQTIFSDRLIAIPCHLFKRSDVRRTKPSDSYH